MKNDNINSFISENEKNELTSKRTYTFNKSKDKKSKSTKKNAVKILSLKKNSLSKSTKSNLPELSQEYDAQRN